jgi:predicted dehydrogenase
VSEVTALLDVGTSRYEGCDETGEGLIRFAGGAIGTLAAAWTDVANPVQYLVSGTEGHAAVIDGKLFFQSKRVDGADGKQPWTDLPEAWPHAFELFLDAVGGKQDVPLVTAHEAAYRSSVMEAVYEGARTKQWVKPK